MNKHLFQYFDFGKHYFPNEQNYNEYDMMIKNSGGIDVQILGIGTNGHIFNEPHSNRFSSTRVVDLTENTIKDNSRFFQRYERCPTQKESLMGLSSIMSWKKYTWSSW